MKALFITGIDYESQIQIGDHHLARQFVQDGWDVAFLSTPITPFHLFSKNKPSLARRLRNHYESGYIHLLNKGKLWSYVPAGLIIPRNILGLSSSFFYQHWIDFTFPNIKKVLVREGFDHVDLLYIRDSTQAVYNSFIQKKFTVFRLADNDAGFNNYTNEVNKNQTQLAKNSDLLVYSANSLEAIVLKLHPKKSLYLPNGVDFQHFCRGSHEIPNYYKDIPEPRVIYIGSIDYWFDFQLINYLADRLRNVSFVIIGESKKYKNRFCERPNIHLLGPIPYKDIPPFLWNSTIGIIPFNLKEYPDLVNFINPIKLYEYMACGLPVIATYWEELNALNTPAHLCKSFCEFAEKINECLDEKKNNDLYKSKLQNFALKNDWKSRYQLLLEATPFVNIPKLVPLDSRNSGIS